MSLSKVKIRTLKEMNGEEMYFRDGVIMIKYPYYWRDGVRKKGGENTWREIYNAYWNERRNEGYWIKREL